MQAAADALFEHGQLFRAQLIRLLATDQIDVDQVGHWHQPGDTLRLRPHAWMNPTPAIRDLAEASEDGVRLRLINIRVADLDLDAILQTPETRDVVALALEDLPLVSEQIGRLVEHRSLDALRELSLRLSIRDRMVRVAGPSARYRARESQQGIAFAALAGLPKLESLQIAGGLDEYGLHALLDGDLPDRLTALDLSGNLLSLAGIDALAATPMTNLDELGLDHCGLDDDALSTLVRSARFSRLHRLSLRRNRIGPGGLVALAHTDRLVGLEELRIGAQEPRRDAGPKADPSSSSDPPIEFKSDESIMAAIVALAHSRLAEDLRRLDLSGLFLGPEAAEALAESAHLEQLQSLDLGRQPLSDRGARALAESSTLAGLQELDLEAIGLTDLGFIDLVRSPSLASLQSLRVDANNIDSKGLRRASGAPVLSQLRKLGLNDNQMRDRCLDPLIRLLDESQIDWVEARDNLFSAAGIQTLFLDEAIDRRLRDHGLERPKATRITKPQIYLNRIGIDI